MRKAFGIFFLIDAVVVALLFFVLLNFSFFINENRIKSLLNDSNIYDTAAFYIKNEIVTKSDFKLDEGSNFEEINKAISAENIKSTVDTAIGNFFIALKNPTDNNLVFPVRFNITQNENAQFNFEKYFNLKNNLAFEILTRKYLILLGLAVLSVLFFIIGALLYSRKAKDDLTYLGLYTLLIAILLAGCVVALREYVPRLIDIGVSKSNVFQEPKLQVSLERLLSLITDRQTIYYIIESISLFVAALLAFFLRKILAKEPLDKIGTKI
jgi:hypothetical protein